MASQFYQDQEGGRQRNALNQALGQQPQQTPQAGWETLGGFQHNPDQKVVNGQSITRGIPSDHNVNMTGDPQEPKVVGQNPNVSRPMDVTQQGHGGGSGLSMAGLHGFDQNNFYDPQMDSVKYKFARLAQKAGARTPSQMSALVLSPEFQQIFPRSTFNGKDWLNFNGALSDGARGGVPVHGIDVLMGADQEADTAQGVWWGAPEAGGGGAGNPGGLGGAANIPSGLERLLAANQTGMATTSLDDILRLLQSQSGGYY